MGTCPLPRRARTLTSVDEVRGAAFILDEDPELAEGLPPELRIRATRLLRAAVLAVFPPRWDPPELDPRTSYGYLVLDGLIGRRARVGRAVSTELLGPGDILRPWEEPCLGSLIPLERDFRVFLPSRLAILDERITRIIGRRPELTVSFSARLIRRARHAEFITAISHLVRVEEKLLATLWHLAGNWGRVTPNGVLLRLPLTHEVLGQILGTQRPSVSTALRRLRARGEVVRTARGDYCLTGDPMNWDGSAIRERATADELQERATADEMATTVTTTNGTTTQVALQVRSARAPAIAPLP